MDERVMQFRVGVFFLATFLITGILLVMFGKMPRMIGTYTIQVRFNAAGGVTRDTPVRKSGILIGRVSDVQLTDRDSKVLVTMDIQSDKIIYRNEACYINRDLLGDTAIVFVPEARRGAGEPVPPNTVLIGAVSDDPTGLKKALAEPIGTVTDTGEALTAASKRLGAAAQRIEEILDPDTQKNIHDVLRDAAASFASVREFLGDQENREKMDQAMRRLPDTLDSMNRTFTATDEALRKFTQPSGPDNKSPIDRMVNTIEMAERTVRTFNEPSRAGEAAPVEQVAKALENLNEITQLMRSIMVKIERGDGTLGALMNDRQLYDRLNRTAKNVEDISFRLKPIVEDARVFMDKTARHPGVIVRDAVKPGIGIK